MVPDSVRNEINEILNNLLNPIFSTTVKSDIHEQIDHLKKILAIYSDLKNFLPALEGLYNQMKRSEENMDEFICLSIVIATQLTVYIAKL